MDAILTRRSIRKYTSDPVPDDVVEQLLRAAMAAPSANNQQPWHFIVVRDRELLNAVPTYQPYTQMLREAPLAIVVCGDPQASPFGQFWVQDCSAATENLLLAAHALGLGAVWLAVYPEQKWVDETRKLFRIPENIVPLAIVSIGYPAEEKPPAERYNPERVHRDRWGG